MRTGLRAICVSVCIISVIAAKEVWAISVTLQPASGSVRGVTSTVSASGNVTVMQYENFDNYAAIVEFGVVDNGMWTAENFANVTSQWSATDWAQIVQPPSGNWSVGMMNHRLMITVRDVRDNSVVATTQTDSHTVM